MNKKISLVFGFLFAFFAISSLFSANVYAAGSLDTPKVDITLLNQDPDPASPGEYLELRFKVVKSGNDPISSLDFNLDLEYPFYFDGSDESLRTLNNWSGQSGDDWYYTLYYKILVEDDVLEGDYEIDLRSRLNDQEIWQVDTFDIRVENNQAMFEFGNLVTSPVKLLSDLDEAEINVEILNIGEEDSENVSVEIEFPEGFTPTYSYSDRVSLGNILADSSKTATFYVDISDEVASGVYNADVIIKYQETNDSKHEYKEKVMNLELPIKKKPKFEIENVEVMQNAHPGQTVDLKIKVKNVGSEDAESVSIRGFKDSMQPFDFDEKSDFIGDLKINGSGEGILTIEISEEAEAKRYQIDLEIRAIDGDSVLIEDETVYLDVENGSDNSGKVGQIIIGLVLLVFVIVASYNAGKNKMLKNLKRK